MGKPLLVDGDKRIEQALQQGGVMVERPSPSLLEYLDTVEAYLEAAEHEIDLARDLPLAGIELACVTATSIQSK